MIKSLVIGCIKFIWVVNSLKLFIKMIKSFVMFEEIGRCYVIKFGEGFILDCN